MNLCTGTDILSDYTVKSQAIRALIISQDFSTLRNINQLKYKVNSWLLIKDNSW